MYHLYGKVIIILFIAYGFVNPFLKTYFQNHWVILIFAPFTILFVFAYQYRWRQSFSSLFYKILGYGMIFSLLTSVIVLRFQMAQKNNPLDYWQQVESPTQDDRDLFFLAEVVSMDGFKKERYRITLNLLSSHHDKRRLTTIHNQILKDIKGTSFSNSVPLSYPDILKKSLQQKLWKFSQPITVYAFSYLHLEGVETGDHILIRPYFVRKTEDIQEGFSYRNYLIATGIYANFYYNPRDFAVLEHRTPPFISQVWNKIRGTLYHYLDYPSSTLAYAMFTGNKEEMPDYIKEYFRSTGTYHVLAVSGMHAGLLSVFFFYIFRILGMRKKRSLALIFFIVLPSYLFITDFQISIQRTYLMGLIGFFLLVFDRNVNLMAILCLSMIAITLYNPPIVYSVSFQLSFTAVFGIAHALRLISVYRSRNPFLNGLWVSVGAQLGTLPIVIYYFGYNNFLSLFYNIVVSFLISVYYLYTLLFLMLGIPFSYFPHWETLNEFISGSLGAFLTYLGNILFLFLHYTAIEFDWFYFPSLKNNLMMAVIMGIILFFFAEILYQYRSHQIKKNFDRMPEHNTN